MYASGRGFPKTLDGYLAWLEACAHDWETGRTTGKPSLEQARVVRRMRLRLLMDAGDGAIDDRQEGNVDQ